jgi:AhpD family alkylhydroperoxidase
MSAFEVHTIDSAPADSSTSLRTLEQGLGFVPNLAATMAESPVLVNGFVDLRNTLAAGELTGVEREIVALAVSLENDCDYCMAAHSAFALMQKANQDAVSAVRRGDEPEDPKLAAL